MNEPSDDTLRALLLGQLPEAQATPLAERLLHDDAFGTRMQALENDLIDDLASGRLAASERDAAILRLSATGPDRLRIRIARALAQRSGRSTDDRLRHARSARGTTPPARRWRRTARATLLASALASTAAVVILFGTYRAPTGPGSSANSEQVRTTLALFASQQRGSRPMTVQIPADATHILLQLEVDLANADPPFQVYLERANQAPFVAGGLEEHLRGPYRVVELVVSAPAFEGVPLRIRLVAANAAEQNWNLRFDRHKPGSPR